MADALSRLGSNLNQINAPSEDETLTASEIGSGTVTADEGLERESQQSDATIHSAEQDNSDLIPHVEVPLNVFKNQIVIRIGKELHSSIQPHPGFNRHHATIEQITYESLTDILKRCLSPNCINGIKIPEAYIQLLNEIYLAHFVSYKIRITQRMVEDICDSNRICSIIEEEHRRAHRNPRENGQHILERFYFPV